MSDDGAAILAALPDDQLWRISGEISARQTLDAIEARPDAAEVIALLERAAAAGTASPDILALLRISRKPRD